MPVKIKIGKGSKGIKNNLMSLLGIKNVSIETVITESSHPDNRGRTSGQSNRIKYLTNKSLYNRNPFRLTDKQEKGIYKRLRRSIVSSFVSGRGLGDFYTQVELVGESMVAIFKSNILSGRLGPGAKPLSPGYRRWKLRNYPGSPDMKLTGGLISSIKSKVKRS